MYQRSMPLAQNAGTPPTTPGVVKARYFRTPEHLERAVAHLNRLAPRPDVALATGDLVGRGEPPENARLRAILDRLAIPLYVIPGQHGPRDAPPRPFAHPGCLAPARGV